MRVKILILNGRDISRWKVYSRRRAARRAWLAELGSDRDARDVTSHRRSSRRLRPFGPLAFLTNAIGQGKASCILSYANFDRPVTPGDICGPESSDRMSCLTPKLSPCTRLEISALSGYDQPLRFGESRREYGPHDSTQLNFSQTFSLQRQQSQLKANFSQFLNDHRLHLSPRRRVKLPDTFAWWIHVGVDAPMTIMRS